MIISMKRHASRAEIDEVTQRIEEFGYKIHTIEGEERVVIGACLLYTSLSLIHI